MIEVTCDESAPLKIRAIAQSCAAGQCPTIYENENSDALIIQGVAVPAERAGLAIPEGEMLVEIPRSLLAEAVRRLS